MFLPHPISIHSLLALHQTRVSIFYEFLSVNLLLNFNYTNCFNSCFVQINHTVMVTSSFRTLFKLLWSYCRWLSPFLLRTWFIIRLLSTINMIESDVCLLICIYIFLKLLKAFDLVNKVHDVSIYFFFSFYMASRDFSVIKINIYFINRPVHALIVNFFSLGIFDKKNASISLVWVKSGKRSYWNRLQPGWKSTLFKWLQWVQCHIFFRQIITHRLPIVICQITIRKRLIHTLHVCLKLFFFYYFLIMWHE